MNFSPQMIRMNMKQIILQLKFCMPQSMRIEKRSTSKTKIPRPKRPRDFAILCFFVPPEGLGFGGIIRLIISYTKNDLPLDQVPFSRLS